MQVGVKVFATLTRHFPNLPLGSVLHVELEKGTTVEELLKKIGISPSEVIVVLRNGKACNISQVLEEGDILSLFPPVGGG
ncbi:MAG: MoaD/ThiS family protein [bacterium]